MSLPLMFLPLSTSLPLSISLPLSVLKETQMRVDSMPYKFLDIYFCISRPRIPQISSSYSSILFHLHVAHHTSSNLFPYLPHIHTLILKPSSQTSSDSYPKSGPES
ncbi:hypothetical protein BDZ45DRAFT_675659 [Acephala macrosclerotiorum]|nr:hypothetical protein BDZ45DRAFT_675659 [Acephala macrosclerotiorum]